MGFLLIDFTTDKIMASYNGGRYNNANSDWQLEHRGYTSFLLEPNTMVILGGAKDSSDAFRSIGILDAVIVDNNIEITFNPPAGTFPSNPKFGCMLLWEAW